MGERVQAVGAAKVAGAPLRYYDLVMAAFVAILLPYEAWRVTYYGALLPNTYYAKAAYLTYWSRGFYYLRTYVLIYILWPFVPVALVGAGMAPRGPARAVIAICCWVLNRREPGGQRALDGMTMVE